MDSFLFRLGETLVKTLSTRMCFQSLFFFFTSFLHTHLFPIRKYIISLQIAQLEGYSSLLSQKFIFFQISYFFILTLALLFLPSVHGSGTRSLLLEAE